MPVESADGNSGSSSSEDHGDGGGGGGDLFHDPLTPRPPPWPPREPCTLLDSLVLEAFTRWDSAQFLDIAVRLGDTSRGVQHAWDGYASEAAHAFLPVYPYLVRLVVGGWVGR